METGVLDVIAVGRGADGKDVANMLNHSSQSNGHDGNDGREEEAPVALAEGIEACVAPMEWGTHPGGIM